MPSVNLSCIFKSELLGMSSSFTLLLPGETPPDGGWPVLWLYHGLSDDHTAWSRWTRVENYAEAHQVAVVMPNVHRSFYTNQVRGFPYFDFVADELPSFCRKNFPLAAAREKNFIAGLSMGGYGALKVSLTHPERFLVAGSFSGALHLSAMDLAEDRETRVREFENTFGDMGKLEGGDHDLIQLVRRARKACKQLPKLYVCCGTDDWIYPANQTFRKEALAVGLDFTYEESPGLHDWAYWEMSIQRFLQYVDEVRGIESPGEA